MKKSEIFEAFKISDQVIGGHWDGWQAKGKKSKVVSPIDNETVAHVSTCDSEDVSAAIKAASKAFETWRQVPGPKRGLVVKALGQEIEAHSEELSQLITLEMGKPIREARGEVQEMVDICDFALGQSRQLYGRTMPSERGLHHFREQYFPLGVVGVITAFNFPSAVWSWNVALALICGNSVLWKPSSKTPLTAVACTKLAEKVLKDFGHPEAVCTLVTGRGGEIGDLIAKDPRVSLVSYTGSVQCGRHVGTLVQERFGRHILELGGNNAVIVSEKGDLDQAFKIVYFGAVGTAGQRCTTTRRVIVHEDVYDEFLQGLKNVYARTPIGDPRDENMLMGPLVDERAVETMLEAKKKIVEQGGRIVCGGERLRDLGSNYITPCIAEAKNDFPLVKEETFVPLLYIMSYRDFSDALDMHNDVPQGLSSAIVTNDLAEAETFLSAVGSDCGLANVNAGTSGAEIGGAFGGEKETGGGRESGSDAWKAYMRRQTSAINFSGQVELAQNIEFDIS